MRATKILSVTTILISALGAGCAGNSGTFPIGAAAAQAQVQGASTASPGSCTPLETRPPEVADFQPSFPGQTRACGIRSNVAHEVVVVTGGLQNPWAVEPLPGGGFLITERPGRMRYVSASGQLGPAIAGVPEVDANGQAGLLDVALSPSFDTDRTVYWSFTEPREGGNGTSVARGVLSADGARLDQVRVILRTQPTYNNNLHFGSRLAFGPDGMLYVTMGERYAEETRVQAQRLDNHLGKTLRIRPDGSPAPGNPFADRSGALPEVWSHGHRNIQAAAFDPQGRFWTIEHGPRGGDELNRVEPGKNFGWPLVTYGMEYNGQRMVGAVAHREGFEPPVYYWSPVIAPSGAQFYTGDAFPAWRGDLFVGGLSSMRLVRLVLQNDRVVGEEHLLTDRQQRIRDVRQGPDGFLYVVADGAQGELLRISPR